MKTKTEFCHKCKSALYKVRAQTSKKDIPLGTYCDHCKAYRNTFGILLVPKLPTKEEVKAALGGLEPAYLPGCSIKKTNPCLDQALNEGDGVYRP